MRQRNGGGDGDDDVLDGDGASGSVVFAAAASIKTRIPTRTHPLPNHCRL